MKKIPVVLNGRLHRISERALELLNLKVREPISEIPINVQKLPPNLEVIKLKKKEVVPEVVQEVEAIAPPVVVKKNEDVIVASAAEPKKRRRGKVGAKK